MSELEPEERAIVEGYITHNLELIAEVARKLPDGTLFGDVYDATNHQPVPKGSGEIVWANPELEAYHQTVAGLVSPEDSGDALRQKAATTTRRRISVMLGSIIRGSSSGIQLGELREEGSGGTPYQQRVLAKAALGYLFTSPPSDEVSD